MKIKEPVLEPAHPLTEFVKTLTKHPLLSGEYHDNLELAADDSLLVKHGLGRPYKGYIICRSDSTSVGSITEDRGHSYKQSTLKLNMASGASTTKFSLWIF